MKVIPITIFLCVVAFPWLSSCGGNASYLTKENRVNRADEKKLSADKYFHTADFGKYVGRIVNEFVGELEFKHGDIYPIDEPPGKLIGFAFQFSDGYVVEIYAYDLQHTKRFSEGRVWNIEDFLQEKISKIVIRHIGEMPYNREFKDQRQ